MRRHCKGKHLKSETVSDVRHCFSAARLDCDLTMFIHCELLILILVLMNDGQVQTGEIIGGGEAAPHSRPYMVLLERYLQNNKKAHCGGFLLNEDIVMTAAHCQARAYIVFLGVHDFQKTNEVQRISVEQSFPHKDYNASNYKNDIMLLKLSSKAKYSNNVRPIALANQDDGSLPKSCSTSGWGRTGKNSTYMSNVLMEVNVTLTDSEPCDGNNFYCSEGDSGPGRGDSGGPLVCGGMAYGVVSYNFKPHSGGREINYYAKIPDNRRLINSTMINA
ncbi:mast cell protease 8-like isoform X2 [Centropristis striata]|uniref:mast cell protease 8-like isoform X2 n=1 Tax=Centropristis striata TaxID=184440 RepID=UPI0027E084F7|nr:mast cell protease 8-like isoform X2 [Centropristis striata]